VNRNYLRILLVTFLKNVSVELSETSASSGVLTCLRSQFFDALVRLANV